MFKVVKLLGLKYDLQIEVYKILYICFLILYICYIHGNINKW